MRIVLFFSIAYVLIVAFLSRRKLHELHPRKFFLETWREADRIAAEARAERAAAAAAALAAVTPPASAAPTAPLDANTSDAAPTSVPNADALTPGAEPVAPVSPATPAVAIVSPPAPAAAPAAVPRFDYHAIVAFVSLAVVLTLQEYYGNRGMFDRLRDQGLVFEWGGGPAGHATHRWRIFGPVRWMDSVRWGELYSLSWWVFTRWAGYVIIPVIVIWLWRKRVRDFGLSVKGFLEHAWIYALFFGIVLIAVVLVSNTGEFANYYPFYRQSNRSWRDFWYWEILYASQFLALEFFFRGYLIFSGVKSMGSGVIVAMVVPYCMIHYGKPFAESMAAILAGVVLGTLSLKTRSIWSGFLIHVTVALSMDMAALLQTRGLPGGFRLPASWGF